MSPGGLRFPRPVKTRGCPRPVPSAERLPHSSLPCRSRSQARACGAPNPCGKASSGYWRRGARRREGQGGQRSAHRVAVPSRRRDAGHYRPVTMAGAKVRYHALMHRGQDALSNRVPQWLEELFSHWNTGQPLESRSVGETARWLDYDFHVCGPPHGRLWPEQPGIYVLAGRDWAGWFPLYVGKTKSFRSRLSSHEEWALAEQRGATHVHILPISRQITRDLIEYRFFHQLRPPLNKTSPSPPPFPRF